MRAADSCADCRFFDRHMSGHGVCRRNPPTLHAFYGGISERDGQVMTSEVSGWPDVDDTDWCGEYAPRPCGAQFTSNVGGNGNVYVEPFTYVCDLRIGHDGRHSCADFRVGTNMNKYKAVSR